ncbi:deazaflavin-dependent oxidoreductase (nitroreductase family) [Gordonia humi]|uniref:Deazaflavin-dependent oxidoreductase (Nitroreductase family) n=2 Tax=Gordonia humi TaxID=686429 RepID=A0A840EX80_9ACTN|nr:deazaflavin-dependent oxidoreductase (nitroreductase family) [Gordonia humi]
MSDMNTQIIEEFRANEGRVGGPFEGAPMILVHHVGRKSGKQTVAPLMYLPGDDPSVLYIFASKAGAPTNPAYYYNLVDAGRATVEVGTETFDVAVTEVTGADRDRIYAEQASRYPGFADYEEKTKGVRVIPVLKLTRV